MANSLDTLIIDALSEPVLVLDAQAAIVRCNAAAARLFDYTAEDLQQLVLADLLKESEQSIQTFLQRWNNSAASSSEEVLMQRKTGVTFPLSLCGRAIVSENRRYYILELRDLSQDQRVRQAMRTAREQADAADAAKAEFLALISHEIRNPINTIIGALNLLLSTPLDENQTSLLETAHSSGESLRNIINDILDYTRLEAGQIEPKRSDFDVIALVESVAELLAPPALAKELEIATVIYPDVPQWVRSDSGRIRQILLHLTDNAIKYTQQGGVCIKVSCVRRDDARRDDARRDDARRDALWLRFEIIDTGPGIEQTEQQHIFQAFTQSAPAYSRQHGGIGLGLATCKRLVELMDGELGLHSRPAGGSAFWCELPCAPASVSESSAPMDRTKLARRRVLLAEQNPISAQAHFEQLKLWDMDVTRVNTAKQALQKLRRVKKPFDIVLIDQQLNDDKGVPLAQSLLPTIDVQTTPIILLVTTGSHAVLQTLREGGIHAFLTKPIRQASLYRWLSVALGLDQRDQEEVHRIDELAGRVQEPSNHYRILLVEDSHVNQAVTIAMLKRTGYTVDAVNNGLEALQALRNLPYDLVLMDLSMPEMDGFETTARIRKLPSPISELPIIAVSANVVPEDRERLHKLGINDYVIKPVDRQVLINAIKRWLNPAQAEPVEESLPILDASALEKLTQETNASVMRRIIGLFIEETHGRIAQIGAACQHEDWTRLQREAHTLKSAAGTFGAQRLQARAKELDEACRNQQTQRCRELAEIVLGLTQESLAAIEAYLASSAPED